MKVGIIGTGRMGGSMGARFVAAGHEILFGSRDAAKAQKLADRIGGGAQAGSYTDAANFGDVVLLATPFNVTHEVLAGMGDALDGKVVLEVANDFAGAAGGKASGAQIAEWIPKAKVVMGFNYTFFQILERPAESQQERPSAFIVGNDKAAKALVSELIATIGFDPVDAGSMKNAFHLDALARAIVELGYGQGLGSNIAFKLVWV